jgi:hypothetical protein
MASDNQIVLEIILDDGTIQRGFAKVKSSGDDAAKSIGSSFSSALTSISSPTDILAGLFLIKSALGAIAEIGKTAFEFVLEGEKIKSINAQFDLLAQSSGLAGQAIKSQLESAAGGLADTTDLLKAASEGFVQFGENAKRLPETLALARQVGAVFGGDLVSNFERLNQAIASGSQKALKAVGIYLDTDKVLKDYSRSLGISVDLLSQEERQQAILNATLEQGKKKYAEVDLTLNQTGDAFVRLKNAAKDSLEAASVLASNVFGPAFRDAFDLIAAGAKKAKDAIDKNYGSGADKLNASIKDIQDQIKELEAVSNGAVNSISDIGLLAAGPVQARLEGFRETLRLLNRQLSDLGGRSSEDAKAQSEQAIKEEQKRLQRNSDFKLAEEIRFNTAIATIKQAGIEKSIALAADGEGTAEQKLIAQLDGLNALRIAKEQEFINQDNKLELDFRTGKIATIQQFNDEEKILKAKLGQDLADINDKANKLILDTDKKSRQQQIDGTRTALGQIATLQQNSTGTLAEIGKAAAIAQATIDGYRAVQNALATVPYPFNFAAAALVGAAAAANIAKISAVGGGGGGSSFAPASGTADNPTVVEPIGPTPTADLTRRNDTSVVVNIQGDVLDSDETGLRITRLLNDAFDKQGVSVRRGVLA